MTRIDPALAATAALALGTAHANGVDLSISGATRTLRELAIEDPMRAAVGTVLGCSALFFLAERGVNPEVHRFEDALVFCTTCLNVGHADVFAKTPAGRAIASFLMTFGPALAAKIFDPPRCEIDTQSAELAAAQRAIADKLDAILIELRR